MNIAEGTLITQIDNPPPLGETSREDVLPALKFTVTEAAEKLGVLRAALSRVLDGRATISPQMALRLECWLGANNGGRADLWIVRPASYDHWHARKAGAPKVKRAPRTASAISEKEWTIPGAVHWEGAALE